jgi:hypothetical protein
MILAVVQWAFESFDGFFDEVGIVGVDPCLGSSFFRFRVVIGLIEVLSLSLIAGCLFWYV